MQLAGVTLAMGGGFDSTIDFPDGRGFAAELRLDIAAALHAHENRYLPTEMVSQCKHT